MLSSHWECEYGPSLCKCGLLLLFPSSLVGLGGTQILFKKQEDSLAVNSVACALYHFPLFTSSSEQISISFPLLSFFLF